MAEKRNIGSITDGTFTEVGDEGVKEGDTLVLDASMPPRRMRAVALAHERWQKQGHYQTVESVNKKKGDA